VPALGKPSHVGAGLTTCIVIALIGALVFRDSESAMQATGLVAFFAGLAVFHFFDERARRRLRKRSQ
jgi:hypothetical protein